MHIDENETKKIYSATKMHRNKKERSFGDRKT